MRNTIPKFLSLPSLVFSDLMVLNIMMDADALWSERHHIMDYRMNRPFTSRVKLALSRTASRPKYYIIDFGLSRQYPPDSCIETAPEGGDRTVPEFVNGLEETPHDPFAVDIYCVGNVIQEYILDVSCWFLLHGKKVCLNQNVGLLWL